MMEGTTALSPGNFPAASPGVHPGHRDVLIAPVGSGGAPGSGLDLRFSGDGPGFGGLVAALLVLSAVGFMLAAGYVIWWFINLEERADPRQAIGGNPSRAGEWRTVGLGLHLPPGVRHQGSARRCPILHNRRIYTVVDHLWPLWDPKRQALHDKMVNTIVVQNRS